MKSNRCMLPGGILALLIMALLLVNTSQLIARDKKKDKDDTT